VIFVAPPDREARLESRTPVTAKVQPNQFAKVQGSTTCWCVAELARFCRAAPDGRLEFGRRQHGIARPPHARRVHRSRPRHGAARSRHPTLRRRRSFRAGETCRDAGPFERQLYRINVTRASVDRLNRTLALVPYRKPVIGEVEFTSGFGVRSDPFLGRPAMHTGLDFRAAMGDPVRATANGKVISSGWAGGYGRMVEIDHGNGLSTRYGHLSEINVKVGEAIRSAR
jgi:Membrane proteins related to metalloendopeptidases